MSERTRPYSGGLAVPTLADWIQQDWLPVIATQVKESTLDSYERILTRHLLPRFGDFPLDQLDRRLLTAFYAELHHGVEGRRPLAAKTIRNIHVVVHKLLADAVEDDILPSNPADRARLPRRSFTTENELRFWEPHELAEFLAATRGDELGALWHVAAMTGMRRGELLGLCWSEVEFAAARLSVRRNRIAVAYRVVDTSPKTHKARVVDLDAGTVDVLQSVRAEQLATGHFNSRGLVFLSSDGSEFHPDLVSQAFRATIKRVGSRAIRFHDLRHTHATIALRAGVPAKVISERLGHSTPDFTLRQYAHVIPGMQAEAAAQVASLVQSAMPQDY